MFNYSPFSKMPCRSGSLVRLAGQFILAGLLAGAGLLAHAGEAARVVFVAGAVHADSKQLLMGQAVEEGSLIATGADGYLYLKTVDEGFLILRPNTQARIVAYHIDKQQPGNSRVKLELLGGVARSITGEGVKQAKQNFRFNTPVAAIGVRGTDFTVFADQNTARVAVVSGGVVVSPFANGCRPEGVGPCEGDTSRELFASQLGQVLQVSKGQSFPQLLRGVGVAPEGAAPARPDEPQAKAGGSGAKGELVLSPAEQVMTVQRAANLQHEIQAIVTPPANTPTLTPAPPPVASIPVTPAVSTPAVVPEVVAPAPVVIAPVVPEVPPPAQIIWGRWRTVLEQAANVDLIKVMDGSTRLIAMNSEFALLRQKSADGQVPHEGSIGFALQQSEAYILDEPRKALSVARVENGQLNVDFAKASFSTSLDLVSQADQRFKLQAQGNVTSNGVLEGQSQLVRPTNMAVTGILGADKSGAAAYLFQSRLNDTTTATGATYWTKSR
ncbi:MAG: FecR family protein [Sterolibacterium sp.]|nr:FecR family protein [Sterolibacterium sp.]